MAKIRTYEQSHPWIRFNCDTSRFGSNIWMLLGESRSKCEHIAGVPLKPAIAEALHQIYMAKGVFATTSIEGNTLTEKQVLEHLEGKLILPRSKEYLGKELSNVRDALNVVSTRWLYSESTELSVGHIKEYNRIILDGLDVEDGVVPGCVRHHSVAVGPYLGAPAQDCEYLLARMCEWLNHPTFCPSGDERIILGIIRAVLAHLYIAWIHPFGDGNGRTARMIEFQILITAGVPTPAAHLLSNHYNATRQEYIRQLDRASKSGGDIAPFIEYALQGFVDGLKEQLDTIRTQQWDIAWKDYIHEEFKDRDSVAETRQRHFALDLSDHEGPISLSKLRDISVRVATSYNARAPRTFKRDLLELLRAGLVRREGNGFVSNRELMLAFLPQRREQGGASKEIEIDIDEIKPH